METKILGQIKEGNINIAIFHAITICRRKRNCIEWPSNDQGNWYYNKSPINNLLVSHFNDILIPPSNTLPQTYHFPDDLFAQVIPEDMNCRLCMCPMEDEIRITIFSIEALKAPGPIGFPSLFYQKSWATVGSKLTRMVQNFFTNPHDHSFINHTNITLIPKLINPYTPDDYRPINLCNTQYKTILKIQANKLKPHMPKFISLFQGAYVTNRQITDNTILAHKILPSIKLKKHIWVCHGGNQGTNVQSLRPYQLGRHYP